MTDNNDNKSDSGSETIVDESEYSSHDSDSDSNSDSGDSSFIDDDNDNDYDDDESLIESNSSKRKRSDDEESNDEESNDDELTLKLKDPFTGKNIYITLLPFLEEGRDDVVDLTEQPNKKQKITNTIDDESNELIRIQSEITQYKLSKNKSSNPRDRILLLKVDIPTKAYILDKYDELSKDTHDGSKITSWINSLCKIPFGNYRVPSVRLSDGSEKIQEYLFNIKINLDNSVYGLKDAKEEILTFICNQIINPNANGKVLGLHGSKGVAKSRLAKKGIAESLNRPFHTINLGGVTDASTLIGHNYTYVGSSYGRLAQILINSECMNPVILLDEIDKISDSNSRSVFGVFTHLLDATTNNEFQDLYFQGIKLDFSKTLFVIAFNDSNYVNDITADRMKIIEIPDPSKNDKIEISKRIMIPEILEQYKNEFDFSFSDEMIRYVIERKTMNEAGMRKSGDSFRTLIERICLSYVTQGNFYKKVYCSIKEYNEIEENTDKTKVVITYDIIDEILKDYIEKNDVPLHMYI